MDRICSGVRTGGTRRLPWYNSGVLPGRGRAVSTTPHRLHRSVMAKRCELCGKGPVVGRNISHAHNVTPRRFEPNLQRVRALVNGGHPAACASAPAACGRTRSSRPPKRVRQRADAAASAPGGLVGSRAQGDRPLLPGHPGRVAAFRVRSDPPRPGDRCPGRWGHRRPDAPRLRQPASHPRGRRRLVRQRRPDDRSTWPT